MRILITGGCGFIGSRLHGHLPHATIVDTAIGKSVQSLTSLPYDVVFHLAAIPRVGISLEMPEDVINENVSSLLHVLDLAKTSGSRVIFASSSSVKHASLSHNPYALSKHFGEQLVNLYRDTFNVNATSVRLFNVYGPGESFAGKYTTLVKACKFGLTSGKGFAIDGYGTNVRDFTHVDDVCLGLIAAINDKRPLLEIGSGNAHVRVLDIVNAFREGTDLPIVWRDGRFCDPTNTCADSNLAPDGWISKFDVIEYIKEWKRNGCLEHE